MLHFSPFYIHFSKNNRSFSEKNPDNFVVVADSPKIAPRTAPAITLLLLPSLLPK